MNELSKELKCIQIRSGVEIWLEAERIPKLLERINSNERFIEVDGQIINKADVVGVFGATAMEETTRRKNGEWKCTYGNWHKKFETCECFRHSVEICPTCGVSPCLCD